MLAYLHLELVRLDYVDCVSHCTPNIILDGINSRGRHVSPLSQHHQRVAAPIPVPICGMEWKADTIGVNGRMGMRMGMRQSNTSPGNLLNMTRFEFCNKTKPFPFQMPKMSSNISKCQLSTILAMSTHVRDVYDGSWELVGMDTFFPLRDSRVDIQPEGEERERVTHMTTKLAYKGCPSM